MISRESISGLTDDTIETQIEYGYEYEYDDDK